MIRSILFCFFLAPLIIGAQSVKEEVELYQSLYGMEKKKAAAQVFQPEKQFNQDFWFLYDEYEDKRKAIGQQRVSNIFNYVNNYTTLNNEQLDYLILSSIKQRGQLDKLIKNYHKKIKKISDSKTAAQFVQLELFFLSATRTELMANLPFIGALDE